MRNPEFNDTREVSRRSPPRPTAEAFPYGVLVAAIVAESPVSMGGPAFEAVVA